MGGAPVRIKCEVEISAILNYAIVHQLAFFAFVCITQLFLALRYHLLLCVCVCVFMHVCVAYICVHSSLQSGYTAIEIASFQGHREVVWLLKQLQIAEAVETRRKVHIHANCSSEI